eukprot:g39607.t1
MDAPLVPKNHLSPGTMKALQWFAGAVLLWLMIGVIMIFVAGAKGSPSTSKSLAVSLSGMCLGIMLATTMTLLNWSRYDHFDAAVRYLAYGQAFAMLVLTSSQVGFLYTKAVPSYNVGGVVSNVVGSGLLLENNGEKLAVGSCPNNCCAFEFPNKVEDGVGFAISIAQQPQGSACHPVTGTAGMISGRNHITASFKCIVSYSVGGSISGLKNEGLVLTLVATTSQSQAIDPKDTTFTFTNVQQGSNWEVSIASQPDGQRCVISNNKGDDLTSSYDRVAVICS